MTKKRLRIAHLSFLLLGATRLSWGSSIPPQSQKHPERPTTKKSSTLSMDRKRKKHIKKYPHKEWRRPQCSPKFFMWVAPSPLFSRTIGPHIKNFRVGFEKWGMVGAFLYVYVLFSLLNGSLLDFLGFRGGTSCVLVNRVFVPCQKGGCILPTENKGFAPQTPDNDENVAQGNQESPRQTKPKKGPKRKVHEFRPFLWILVFFLRKTSKVHIELLFRNAPWEKFMNRPFFGLVCRGHWGKGMV